VRELWDAILHLFCTSLSLDVLEKHRYWNRNEVLNREWSCDRQIPKGNEICLLRVEIDEASDAVCVSVKSKEDFIVASIDNCVVSRHLRFEDYRLLFEYIPLILKEADICLLRPLKLEG
jgi:hypothetical protein